MVTANLGNVALDAAVLDPDISARGFVLTCSATVAGPGVELELGVGDKMYDVGVRFFRVFAVLKYRLAGVTFDRRTDRDIPYVHRYVRICRTKICFRRRLQYSSQLRRCWS